MEYKDFYITFTDDASQNFGGYYCEVYKKEDKNFDEVLDWFTISEDERDAKEYVKKYIDREFYSL